MDVAIFRDTRRVQILVHDESLRSTVGNGTKDLSDPDGLLAKKRRKSACYLSCGSVAVIRTAQDFKH